MDSEGEGDDTATDTAPTDSESTLVVLDGSATVAANPFNPFSAIVTVVVDHDATVVVDHGETELDHQTPPVSALAGQPVEVVVLGLRADRAHTLRAAATFGSSRWESKPESFQTDPLPRSWPSCQPEFSVDESYFSRDEVVCTNGSRSDGTYMYMCVDRWGEPVFAIHTDANDSLMSMRPLRGGGWASTSFTNSKVALFDATGELVDQFTPSWFEGRTRFEHTNIDSHEMYQIPTGQWAGALAFLTNTYERFEDRSYKLGNGIIVFDPLTEEVLYDYSFHGELGDGVAMDEKLPYSRDGYGDFDEDWNHGNTLLLQIDPDGREYFLVSLKSQDWILKLHPDTDTLDWALGFEGDFQLVDDLDAATPVPVRDVEWQFHQHGVVFLEHDGPRSRLLMFDNGYPRSDESGYRWELAYSRILELEIDEESRLASIRFDYGDHRSSNPDHLFSTTCGNTELLPGDEAVLALEGESKQFVEVAYPGGDRRWSMTCESVEWCEYRVHYAPDLYHLTWDDR